MTICVCAYTFLYILFEGTVWCSVQSKNKRSKGSIQSTWSIWRWTTKGTDPCTRSHLCHNVIFSSIYAGMYSNSLLTKYHNVILFWCCWIETSVLIVFDSLWDIIVLAIFMLVFNVINQINIYMDQQAISITINWTKNHFQM